MKKPKGLTIVEILVLMSIIAIMMAILIPVLNHIRNWTIITQFNNISKVGIENVNNGLINFGIKKKLFTQEQVDAETEKFDKKISLLTFGKITDEGLTNLTPEEVKALKKGIQKNWFSIETIETRQEVFEEIQILELKTILKNIRENNPLKLLDPNIPF